MSPDLGCLLLHLHGVMHVACNLQRGEEDWLELISGTWRIVRKVQVTLEMVDASASF
jgi:hypothetical protein